VICDAFRPRDGACPVVAVNRTVRLAVLSVPVSGSARGPAPFGVPYRQLVLDQAYVLPGGLCGRAAWDVAGGDQ
jgi:hypothetical protein